MHARLQFLAIGHAVASSQDTAALVPRTATPAAFASSADETLKLSTWTAPVSGARKPGSMSTWSLTVDDTATGHKQPVLGFGACITDATTSVLSGLSQAQQSQILSNLFSTSGNDFSLMRHTIGSSDLSPKVYTYDDTTSPDVNLTSFSLGASGAAQANLIKAIRGVQSNLTMLGSPWSPPGWMKTDKETIGSTVNNTLNQVYASSWAQYFVQYIKAFNSLGARIDAVTIQNEPLNNKSTMPTMVIQGPEAAGLILNNLGPALASANLNTQIWAYDHNTNRPDYPQDVLDTAGQYTNTVAWHCYANPNNWGVLTSFHNNNTGVMQVMTECYTSNGTTWDQAAGFTMGPLQNWASGALAWTLATDTNYGPHLSGNGPCYTCRGLVVVDTAAKTYSYAIDYYMMGQFSRFMPKGATILSTTGSHDYGNGSKVEATASRNPDNTRTLVVHSTFNESLYLTLTTKSGQTWSGPLYPESVTTWLLPA